MAPRLEVLRQLREEGVRLAESTFYRLLAEVEETITMPARTTAAEGTVNE